MLENIFQLSFEIDFLHLFFKLFKVKYFEEALFIICFHYIVVRHVPKKFFVSLFIFFFLYLFYALIFMETFAKIKKSIKELTTLEFCTFLFYLKCFNFKLRDLDNLMTK